MHAAVEAEIADPERYGSAKAHSDPIAGAQDTHRPSDSGTGTSGVPQASHIRYFGDYELLKEIARGGMGVVYRARQVSLNRTVAVKTILAGHLASAADVERFRAEAQAAASLQHPNIVAIHEVGEQDGQQYFSMEYIQGRNFAEIVREGPLPARQAAAYLKTIAEAIHFAHERGILHRDLKPSNVLLDQFDQPRVTDFGLAKRVESKDDTPAQSGASQPSTQGRSHLTLTGQVLGSPNFMPPEQAGSKHGQVGPQSDVYALGAILYHLLTGRPPFVAETLAEILQRVQDSDPLSPRLLNPAVPRDLETICLKCLEKEPRRRYSTARELTDELDRFLRDESILARPAGQAEKLWRWCRRKPALATLAVIVVALLASVTMLSLVAARRATAARDAEKRERLTAERGRTNEMKLRLKAEKAEKIARTEVTNSVRVARFLKDMLRSVRPSVAMGRDTKLLRDLVDQAAKRVGSEFKDHPEMEANLRFTLGQVYFDIGDYATAEEMNRAELAIWQKLRPEVDGAVAYSLNNVALSLTEQGKLDEAEKLQRQALAIHEKLHPEPNYEMIATLGNLGMTVMKRGQLADAETLFQQAVAQARQLPHDERLSLPVALDNLGVLLSRTGRYEEAEKLAQEALDRTKERHGKEHPEVARSLNNLGMVLLRQRRASEAEPLLRQALAMRIKFLGATHPRVANTLESLGTLLARQQRMAEAEPVFRQLVENYRARRPADSEEVLVAAANLGRVLAARVWMERNGPDLTAAANSAREAVQIMRDCVARRSQMWSPTSSKLADMKSRLAGALVALAATDTARNTEERLAYLTEAEPLLTAAYNTIQPRAKPGSGEERDEVERFIQVYETWETLFPNTGKATLADDWRKKLAALPARDTSGAPNDSPQK